MNLLLSYVETYFGGGEVNVHCACTKCKGRSHPKSKRCARPVCQRALLLVGTELRAQGCEEAQEGSA
jgi:hypothetical protein